MCVGDDRTGTLAVEVGLRIGDDHTFGTEQELGRELFIFMNDAGCEAQIAEDGTCEEIAAGGTTDVVVAHIVGTVLYRTVLIGPDSSVCAGEVEDNHLGTAVAYQTDAVLVRGLDELVVAVDELQVFASCRLDACVPGFAESFVVLADIDDVSAVFHQVVHRTLFRAVVNDDNLPFAALHGEGEDAVDTRAEHLHWQVVIGQDETD